MLECGRHPNIELITQAKLTGLAGQAGDFTARLEIGPRCVDPDKCTDCGLCAQMCPIKVDDEFNYAISKRKAADNLHGQAVPPGCAIDRASCLYFQNGKCRECEKLSPAGAVNLDKMSSQRELRIGAVVLAPAFAPFNATLYNHWRYPELPDVLTSPEYENLLAASGPTRGCVKRPSDGSEPRRVVWLQCVGSRSKSACAKAYCSSICCLSALKQANLLAGQAENGLERTIFFMDMRATGKNFERCYESAKASGVRFLRARPDTLLPGADGGGVRVRYADEQGLERYEDFDLAVLSLGLSAPTGCGELAAAARISLDEFGFAKAKDFSPVASSRPGVFLCGAFLGPRDIAQTVSDASAAACQAAGFLSHSRGGLTAKPGLPVQLSRPGPAVVPSALVVGGGIAGMTAALALAAQGFAAHLVERGFELGGNARCLLSTLHGQDVEEQVKELKRRVSENPRIILHLLSEVSRVEGGAGYFKTRLCSLKEEDRSRLVEHGAAILACGAREAKPDDYGYGRHHRILTHCEIDRALRFGALDPTRLGGVVFIQCVGSREPKRPYCSRVCCTHTLATAIYFKSNNPDCRIYVLYREMRSYGQRELLYQKARELGVIFIRFKLNDRPWVVVGRDEITVYVKDHVLGRLLELPADLLGLAAAIEPNEISGLASQFKASLDSDGWLVEADPKLRPVDSSTRGVFMAGLAHYPKPVEETVAQAQAAAMRAGTLLSRGRWGLSGPTGELEPGSRARCRR